MDQNQLLLGVILAIVGNALVQLFRLMKSPNEINGELATALRALAADHELLARRFERHDVAVVNLTDAVKNLTLRIDRIEPHLTRAPNGRRGD